MSAPIGPTQVCVVMALAGGEHRTSAEIRRYLLATVGTVQAPTRAAIGAALQRLMYRGFVATGHEMRDSVRYWLSYEGAELAYRLGEQGGAS